MLAMKGPFNPKEERMRDIEQEDEIMELCVRNTKLEAEVQTLRARVGELEGALSGLLTAIETHGRFNSLDMTGYPGGNITVSQGLKAKGWWEAVWSAQKALRGE
jgi:hypothetical protein